MLKNYDRLISIISLTIGILSIVASIYLASPDKEANLIALSGWVAATVITFLLSTMHSKYLNKLSNELNDAKNKSIEHQNDMLSQQDNMISYRNISTALSSMINPEPLKDSIREKLNNHLDKQRREKE